MKKNLFYLSLKQWQIFNLLQCEEILLRCTKNNYFIFNQNAPSKAIVMGISGKPLELLDIPKVHNDKIPVIRRYTGGGTVIIDHQTVFCTMIINNTDAETKPYPREIMTWTEQIYSPAFDNCMKNKEDPEKFKLLENDYVMGSKKVGGNAQTIIKDRWVHHTSFLWDYNEENMSYLQLPKKRPEYRQSRKHSDFLLKLHTKLISPIILEEQIKKELSRLFNVIEISESTVNQLVTMSLQQSPDFVHKTKWEDMAAYLAAANSAEQITVSSDVPTRQ